MKKLISILMLIPFLGVAQLQKTKLSTMANAPTGTVHVVATNPLNGVQNYSTTAQLGLLTNKDSLSINGVVKSLFGKPSFTISVPTGSTTVLTASTNITVSGAAPNYTISAATPTAQTTILTGSTNITVSGSAPNYTISTPTQTAGLQPALTASTNITINSNTISAASPTITAGSNMSVTTSGLNYTVAATTQTAGLISLSSLSATAPLSYNNTTGVFTITPSFTNTALNGTTTVTGAINHSMTASAASSATVNLSTWTGNYGHITGTVTITNFGTVQAGAQRIITFDGALTVTSNTAAIILPGNSNIATAANDVMMLVSEGSGVWRCTSYMRADESYTNYTPSWTGFSSTPTITAGDARYKMISKNTCHVIIWVTTAGTSNTNALTVTLPFTAASTGGGGNGLQQSVMGVLNNGVQVNGSVRSRASSSNILDCYNGIVGATFTTSGSKGVFLNYIYQTE